MSQNTTNPDRTKFATQMKTDLLEALRALADQEGRHIQSLVEEAVGNLLEERRQGAPRAHVMKAYQKSHERYASLYEKLAK